MKPVFELIRTMSGDQECWEIVLREESLSKHIDELLKGYDREPDILQAGQVEDRPVLDPENILSRMVEPVIYSNVSEWSDKPEEIRYFLVDERAGE